MELIVEIGLLIMLSGAGAFIAKLFRQPIIPAYILSGVVVGNFLGLGHNSETITAISEMGIAFLLFMVGLELHFKKLKDLGLVSAFAGGAQIAVTFALGWGVTKLLGFGKMEAIYLGIVLALSSTMIVVKISSDKREINTLHGRLVIGILIIQDIFAVCALSYLSAMGKEGGMSLIFLPKLLVLIIVGILLSKYVFPSIFEFAAKSQELLLVVALSVCFTFALLAELAGTSVAIGAFFAGILLANLPYNLQIVGRVTTLRDFFSILFFTALGIQLNLTGVTSLIIPTLIIAVMVIIMKPIIIYMIFALLRYTPKTSFLTSTSLAQVSEFSLILVAMGISAGAINPNILTITLLLAIITMSTTTYFMKFEDGLYKRFRAAMSFMGIKLKRQTAEDKKKIDAEIILAGYDRIGYSILKALKRNKRKVLVVDFDPDIIKRLRRLNVPCLYGDVCDAEIMKRLDIKNIKLAISTANKYEDNLLFLKKVKAQNNYASTIVTAHKIDEALNLYENGADYVILPHFLGGEMVSTILPDFESNQVKMAMHKYRHISELLARKDLGQEHPDSVMN